MWELFTKAASQAAYAGKQVGKSLAAGKSEADLGLQSGQLGPAVTRVGRFMYSLSLAWIAASWYTGYANERTKEGEPKFIVPGSKKPVIGSPARKDKTLAQLKNKQSSIAAIGENISKTTLASSNSNNSPEVKGRQLIALAPDQLGVPGTAVAGYLWSAPDNQKQEPPYNVNVYKELFAFAMKIANKYGLKVTSGYRPESTGSLHALGLAFDMVGTMNNMKRAASWAAENPGLFQEIFIHNEGSGIHLHLGMYPDAAKIFNHPSNKYTESNTTQSIAPAQSRAIIV